MPHHPHHARRTGACRKSAPKKGLLEAQIELSSQGEKLLEYACHGGFNNQRRNLLHGLFMAYALNRTLVLSPPLSHRDAPGYGSCPMSVHSPSTLRFQYAKAAARAEGEARTKVLRFKRRSFENGTQCQSRSIDTRAMASLRRMLALDSVSDLVSTVDWAELRRKDEVSSMHTVLASEYDCTNTVWTFGSNKNCHAADWTPKAGCACRSVVDLFDTSATLLQTGSAFKGVDISSFIRTYGNAIHQRLQYASLEYSEPFHYALRTAIYEKFSLLATFKKKMSVRCPPHKDTMFAYAALHIRGSDGDFRRRIDASLSRAFRELRSQLSNDKFMLQTDTLFLYIASDVTISSLQRKSNFKSGIESLRDLLSLGKEKKHQAEPSVRLLSLKQLIPSNPEAAIYRAAMQVWNHDHKAAAALATTPDLEAHFDLLFAASSGLAFAGTAGSSFTSSIRTLRKFRMKPPVVS